MTEYYYNADWQLLETRTDDQKTSYASGEPALATEPHEQWVWSTRYIDAPVRRRMLGASLVV